MIGLCCMTLTILVNGEEGGDEWGHNPERDLPILWSGLSGFLVSFAALCICFCCCSLRRRSQKGEEIGLVDLE